MHARGDSAFGSVLACEKRVLRAGAARTAVSVAQKKARGSCACVTASVPLRQGVVSVSTQILAPSKDVPVPMLTVKFDVSLPLNERHGSVPGGG
jgi:hypothetical protein